MRRLAVTFTLTASLAVVLALVVLTADPGEWTMSSIALVSIGALATTLVFVSGFLLVHAPWARWGLVGVTAGAMILSSVNGSTGGWLILIFGGVTIIGLAGPWLRFWVRQQPVPEALSPVVVSLMAAAPVAPLVVGISAYDTASAAQWVAAGVAVTASFLYGRGLPGALWLLRLGVPLAAVPAVLASPYPHVGLLVVSTAFVTALAWLPAARHATATPAPVLPTPLQRRETADAED